MLQVHFHFICWKSQYELTIYLNRLGRSWTVTEKGIAHDRKVNGILGLLYREMFLGLVTIGGKEEPAYTFDHYGACPDWEDPSGRVFGNKAERVKAELWVSIRCTTLLNTSHSLNNLQIMT